MIRSCRYCYNNVLICSYCRKKNHFQIYCQQKQRKQNANSTVKGKDIHKFDDEIDHNIISTVQIEDKWDY